MRVCLSNREKKQNLGMSADFVLKEILYYYLQKKRKNNIV